MKKKRSKPFKRLAYALLPPRLLKYQIALRDYRRGEPEIRLLKELCPADTVAVDIGGFMGSYTWFLERIASHVHVFEPQPYCADFISRAAASNVTVHHCALSDQVGSCSLNLPVQDGPSQAARIGDDKQLDADGRQIQVELKTLDSYELENVGFIKIDAEGAEEKILTGAADTLQRCSPTLLIEIEQRHIGKPIDEIFNSIQALGYKGSYFNAGEIHPLDTFSVDEHQKARLAGDRSKPYINNFIFNPE